MVKHSAGILLFRYSNAELEVLLVHPGGPIWATKDAGVWSIPKGEYLAGEDPLLAARREFAEEIGVPLEGDFIPLGEVKQAGRKIIHAWALEGDLDPSVVQSNTFTMEWPPKSGSMRQFPEIDSAQWCSLLMAREKLIPAQLEFLRRLFENFGSGKCERPRPEA